MKIILTILLAFTVLAVNAQTKKPDSLTYTFSEPQVILISQLLSYGESAVGIVTKYPQGIITPIMPRC